jgi:formyl-CoA transferase
LSGLSYEFGIETIFRRLARAMGNEALADDPCFHTNADRVRNVEALDAIVGAFIARRMLQDNLDFFGEQESPPASPTW